jgi:hypothetical protein
MQIFYFEAPVMHPVKKRWVNGQLDRSCSWSKAKVFNNVFGL